MKKIKKLVRWIILLVLIPIFYLIVSLILTFIPINNQQENSGKNESIYLNSNGIHLDIVIPKNQMDPNLLDGLIYFKKDNYFSFGWGDKNFYLNTPTWNDLTFNNAYQALFLKMPAVIHLTKYSKLKSKWVKIKVNQDQLDEINRYIYKTFCFDSLNKKIILKNRGYSYNDDFYEAMGSFSSFKTCNSWVNSGLKQSGITACLWTPFDFGLLSIHRK